MKHSANKSGSLGSIIITAVVTLIIVAVLAAFAGKYVYDNYLKVELETVTVRFISADSEESVSALPGETVSLPTAAEKEGYSFAYWADETGAKLTDGFTAEKNDSVVTANYLLNRTFEGSEHKPLFTADSNGFYHPASDFTRADAVVFLKMLMTDPDTSGKGYEDVDNSAVYARAASAVKNAGIIRGEKLYPDRGVTLAELSAMVSAIFPDACDDFFGASASESADEVLSRYEAAALINAFLGREPDVEKIAALKGAVPDGDTKSEHYADFVEAALGHTADLSSGSEKWTKNDKINHFNPGMQYIDGKKRLVKEDGTFAVNETIGNFYFDENGVYTSGNAELDEIVDGIIAEQTTEEMDDMEKLKAVYLYVVKNFSYRKGEIYEIGQTGWIADEALKLFTTGRGNCYSYAAGFCVLARALGYEACAYSGTCAGETEEPDPHGWVEIELDGKTYFCDAEIEYRSDPYRNMFMMEADSSSCLAWDYYRG